MAVEILPTDQIHQARVNLQLFRENVLLFETGSVVIGGMSPDNGTFGILSSPDVLWQNLSLGFLA